MRLPERLESLEELIHEGRVHLTITGANGWSMHSDDDDLVATETVRMVDIILKSGQIVDIGGC